MFDLLIQEIKIKQVVKVLKPVDPMSCRKMHSFYYIQL